MGWWRTIEGQVSALIAVAVVALAASAATGWTALLAHERAADRVYQAHAILSRHQDADMMHDALRADVLAAVVAATDQERGGAAEGARESVARAREDFDGNDTAIERGFGGDALHRRFDDTHDRFLRYAAEAEQLVGQIAAGQPASEQQLASFEEEAADVERLMGALTTSVSAEVAGAERAADRSAVTARFWALVVAGAALAGLSLLAGAVWRGVRATLRAKAAADEESRRLGEQARHESQRHRFAGELSDAFEMARTEPDALEVVAMAAGRIAPAMPTELLLADSSTAHLGVAATNPSSGAPGCPVQSPWDCPAVRRGRTLTFADSDAINACPKLREHPGGGCSAVCVPVSFMGRPLGVLHATAEPGDPPAGPCVERFETLALQTGARIGTLRATQQTELQAATDGLTGLLNRRSLESAVRSLIAQGRAFTLAMADLDHFKRLNDTYGHEAGDRALRVFATVLRAGTRDGDVVARHGGEEFVLVFPELEMLDAVPLLERLRERLGTATREGTAPVFTASFGLADATDGGTLDEILRVADDRLRRAKALGRDRVVADPAAGSGAGLEETLGDAFADAGGLAADADQAVAG